MATVQAARRHGRHRHEARGDVPARGVTVGTRHRHRPPRACGAGGGEGGGNGVGSTRVRGRRRSPSPRRGGGGAWCHPDGVTAPAVRPLKCPPPRRGCRGVRGAANAPCCCIIYKPKEQRARQQLQSPRGPPCPVSRSHRVPLARWHPAARRDNGDKAAHGAGRATGRPDATLAPPRRWRAAAVGTSSASPRPLRRRGTLLPPRRPPAAP